MIRLMIKASPIFLTCLIAACNSASESDELLQDEQITTDNSDTSAATDISNVLLTRTDNSCVSYVGEYRSQVIDIQRALGFDGSVLITQDGNECVFTVNEIPNHDFNDLSAAFATNVSTQQGNYRISATPSFANSVSNLSLQTTNAIMLNGVLLDILPAACYGVGNEPLGQEKIGCGMDQIANPWRYDPMSDHNNFGTDEHNAHTQPDGTYHYHGNPMALFEQDCDILTQTSPVIGFAADGFPIHGSCFSENGNTKKAQSSYRLKQGVRVTVTGYQTPSAGIGLIKSDNYDGQFRGDYEYIEGLGDLDECNGKVVNNQYGYYVTDAFPWVMACFKGTANDTLLKTGNSIAIREHGH